MNTQAKIRSFLSNPTYRRWLFAIFKGLILILLTWAIYHQVFLREDLNDIIAGFDRHFRWEHSGWILLAFGLMPVNWIMETEKWRSLLRPHLKLSFRRALASILAGISVSLFTPNRIGAYGGRLLLIPASKSWLGLTATFIGSVAQWVALWLGGLWGLATVGGDLWPFLSKNYQQYRWLLWGIAIALPILYVHLGHLLERLKKAHFLNNRKWSRKFKLPKAIHSYKKRTLMKVLTIAIGRYLVYSTQYLLLLYGFGFFIDPLLGLAGIGLIFLIQTSVPLPPFMALIARGELAILLWSEFGANELAVLAATFTLFIINLLVPALLGGLTIVRIK